MTLFYDILVKLKLIPDLRVENKRLRKEREEFKYRWMCAEKGRSRLIELYESACAISAQRARELQELRSKNSGG